MDLSPSSSAMAECIENCTACHSICLATVEHCLRRGGEHSSQKHVRLLLDCAQICHTSADFMLRGSELHALTCGVCAQVCERCADDCERMANGDAVMQRCADACRRCAESCRKMSAAA